MSRSDAVTRHQREFSCPVLKRLLEDCGTPQFIPSNDQPIAGFSAIALVDNVSFNRHSLMRSDYFLTS